MEVILLERVEKLGAIGDVVKVKDGFARNFLLPQQEGAPRQRSQPQGLRSQPRADRGRQCRAPHGRREGVEGRRRQDGPADPPGVEHRPALRLGQRPRHRRGARRPRAPRSTKSQVVLDRPIKAIGVHDVKVALHPEVSVTVKVNVARSPDEAELQAQGVDVMAADVRARHGRVHRRVRPERRAGRDARSSCRRRSCRSGRPKTSRPKPQHN